MSSIALAVRVGNLEVQVKELREHLESLAASLEPAEPAHNPNGPRKLCPHCGVVPAYHFHVKHCVARKTNGAP